MKVMLKQNKMNSNYFSVKIQFEVVNEKGKVKKINESYITLGYTFSDAEASIADNLKDDIQVDYIVSSMKREKISEIFKSDAEKFFKYKVAFISLDEEKGTEKKESYNMLVQADDLDSSKKLFIENMKSTLNDYVVEKIEETKIKKVFAIDTNSDYIN